jgi:hypothetical protein
MKNFLRAGLLLAGIVAAFSISGNAQVSRQYAAHIPFDFKVGSKVFKAGDYRIAPLDGITDQRAIILQNRSTSKAAIVGQAKIASSGTSAGGQLTFIGNNDGWLLKEVKTSGFTLNVKTSGAEADNMASNKKPEETQTVSIDR